MIPLARTLAVLLASSAAWAAPPRDADDTSSAARRAAEAGARAVPNPQTREIQLDVPAQCGGEAMVALRAELLAMETGDPQYYVELWSDRQTYRIHDEVYYYVRTNRASYATLFWLGPDDSVFMPFSNIPLEAERTHRLDPDNIVVEPTGRETWRLVATIEPQRFPCAPDEPALLAELARLRSGFHAVARWEVTSTSR